MVLLLLALSILLTTTGRGLRLLAYLLKVSR